jgi:predicted DNA-binding transcriptional regulator YafY
MLKFKPQFRRLMFIDRKIREQTYPNCVSLAAEWEVSEKTIQRDIEYLRDELDAPIAYDSLKHGYHYTEENYSLPAITVSESDLFAVFVAETVLSQYRNTPLFQKLSSVFQKIRIRFSPAVAPYIREREWHPKQTLRNLRNGGLVLEFTTNHINEVKDWVLSWGPGATALAPTLLVQKVKESLKHAAENYKK